MNIKQVVSGCILPIFCDPIQHNDDVSTERWDSSFYVHFYHKHIGAGTGFYFLILQQNDILYYIKSLPEGIKISLFLILQTKNITIFVAIEHCNSLLRLTIMLCVSVLNMDYYQA
jgi:hypothetical protein